MARVSGRDLSVQYALEEVEGPQGEDRQDWRAAWLAWWVVRAQGGAKNIDPDVFFTETFRHPAPALEVQLDLANAFIDRDIHGLNSLPADKAIIFQAMPCLEHTHRLYQLGAIH